MASHMNFQVVHINIRGIRSNGDNLANYLKHKGYPDFVTLNETKLKHDQQINIDNYDCIARKEKRGGQHGSAILKRNDISDVTVLNEFNQFYEEVIGVRLNGNSRRPTINIVTYYNPPNTVVNSGIFRTCDGLRGKTVITGDLNSKHRYWGSTKNDQQGYSLLKSINDNRFFILNNGEKTRYDPVSGKEQVLDLILCNSEMVNDFIKWTVDEDVGSDHFPIRASFGNANVRDLRQWYRNAKDADWSQFTTLLSSISIIQPQTAHELDNAVEAITSKIIDAFETACPMKPSRHTRHKPFSPDMIMIVKEKRHLRRLKAEARRVDDSFRVASLQREINKKNNDLKKLQKANHRTQISSLCSELSREKDSGRFFRLFDTIRGKKETNDCSSSDINYNAESASNDQAKAEIFANRLADLHQTKDDPCFNQQWKDEVESYVANRKSMFFVDKSSKYDEREPGDDDPLLATISVDEIVQQLKNCKNKSAPGEDGISYVILKKLPRNMICNIAMIFNASLSLGYFPQSWKAAVVKMVPKPGKDKKEAKNWRPISLLPCLGKLYERIIANRLTFFLENNDLLSSYQSGFRKGRMTSEQLFRLSEDAYGSLKKKGITAALLLDAEAAFDQAWHDAIRYKISKFNLPTKIVRLISSFLRDRKLKVKFGSKTSKDVTMGAGTPQGSCLSPLLYILLVNDVPDLSSNASLGQFADDMALWTNAYTTRGSINRLQSAVNVLEGWCRRWRIKLNGTKSNLMVINRLPNQKTEELSLQLFNDIIHATPTARYLGVEFDDKMRFKHHFDAVESKVTARMNVFKLLAKNNVDNCTMIRLYKTYVRPLFEYGSISFLPEGIKRFQKIQNEFIRVSLRLPRYLSTDVIHNAAGLQPLDARIHSLNVKLMEKMINQKCVQDTIEKSLTVIPLNNYKSPLDNLIE